MEAKELRIGNLVYVYWVDAGRKVETNYGVHYQNISKPLMVMDTFPTGYGCNLEHVKPIKLDYKQLKALGFVFTEEPKKEWILNNVHIVLYADGYYYLCVHDYQVGKKLEYVHQLQNLYFELKGEELIYDDGKGH